MPLGEADTRAKLIDPAMHARGWTEEPIRREVTAGAVEVVEGQARRRANAGWCAAQGRGTRIDMATGKLLFRVYDYTDATRLFGDKFRSRFTPPRKVTATVPGPDAVAPEKTILVEGFDVRVTDAGRYIVTSVDGKAMPITVEEYKESLGERLVEEAPTLPPPATATLKALVSQFARSGTGGLENPQVFETPGVTHAGGLPALRALGQPAEILRQTKERLFAA